MAFDFPNAPTVGQLYQGYVYDGEKWLSTTTPSPPNESGVIAIKVYTASGQYTPSANMTTCVIECVGGGAGGNGSNTIAANYSIAAGGGGGAYARKSVTAAVVGISQIVTIGAGGAGGGTGLAGIAGGDTSVGSLCLAKGAPAPGSGGILTGGLGGPRTGCIGDYTVAGMASGSGAQFTAASGVFISSGSGGNSLLGAGAMPNIWTAANGLVASGYGGGGGGGSTGNAASNVLGGAGANGLVIVTEYGMTALSSASAQLGSVRYDLPQGLTANQTAQARANIWVTKRNFLINGAFQINQGGYVSAAVLAAAAYGHDQWKAGAAGGDYSFTQTTSGATITIAAGKSLIQPIEDVRVTGGGSYVLSWTGTAQARAGVNTLTPAGAYAVSPLLISGQTDGTVMSVEFNTGTLSQVSLTEGTVAPPFQLPDYPTELALCKRYFQYLGVNGYFQASGASQGHGFTVTYSAPMRANPVVTPVGVDPTASGNANTNIAATNWSVVSPLSAYLQLVSTAAGATVIAGYRASANARL